MPVFNAQSTLEYAVRSILEQSWSNLELLCVDDASTDGSHDVLQQMAKQDDRIRIFHLKKNRGCYFCRNVALRNSKGDYITVQDSDDWSHPDRLWLQAQQLMDNPTQIANWSYCMFCNESIRLGFKSLTGFLSMNSSSFMFRRSCISSIGKWDNVRFSADSEYIKRLEIFYGEKAKSLYENVPLCIVRSREASLTASSLTSINTLKQYNGSRFLYRQFYQHYLENKPKERLCECAFSRPRAARPQQRERYDCICVTDLSFETASLMAFMQTVENCCRAGQTVAVLNWARHDLMEFILNDDLANLLNKYRIDLISTADAVTTNELIFFNSDLYRYLPDNLPHITAAKAWLFPDEESSDEACVNLEQAFGCHVVKADRNTLLPFKPCRTQRHH